MSRHIDFIAVLVIAAAMIGFAHMPAVQLPVAFEPIQLQNAVNTDSCPLRAEILSRLAYFLNR